MKKTTKFQNLIKENRRVLIKAYSFKASTVSMWASGERIPKYDTAKRLAVILKMRLKEIPYYRIEKNL